MATSRLLHNRWFGKAVGAAAGLLLAPPEPLPTGVWVAAGLVLGHVYDVWCRRYVHPSQLGALWRRLRPRAARTRPTMHYTFAAMGHIAKAGGRVLPAHINYAEQLMGRLAFSRDDRRQAIAWFSAGKDPNYPFAALADECLAEGARSPVLIEMAVEVMCRTLTLDDNADSRAAAYALCGALGVPPDAVDAVRDELAGLEDAPPPSVADAYRCLELEPGAGADEVKQAYRRKVAQFHPDRLPDGASRREVKLAERRMAECREALEILQATI